MRQQPLAIVPMDAVEEEDEYWENNELSRFIDWFPPPPPTLIPKELNLTMTIRAKASARGLPRRSPFSDAKISRLQVYYLILMHFPEGLDYQDLRQAYNMKYGLPIEREVDVDAGLLCEVYLRDVLHFDKVNKNKIDPF